MKRVLLTAGLCITIVLGCTACGKEQIENIQSIDTVMGTIVSQSVYVTENAKQSGTDAVTTSIYQVLQELEQQVLSWRVDTSEVATINASAGAQEGIALSDEMADILLTCNQIATDSNGAFDITIGEVVRLWDIDSCAINYNQIEQIQDVYTLPSAEDLKAALEKTGYEKLLFVKNELQQQIGTEQVGIDGQEQNGEILVANQQRLVMPEDMQIDLGAVGKGIALDYIHEYLKGRPEVTGAVISVGGSVLTYGSRDGNEIASNPWKVGIVNPLDTNENVGYLMLEGQWCVSTSGDYERYVEVDGKRYHHIIDPATGMPADSGVRSVTILTKNGLESDALSTACFILGVEEGMKLAEEYGVEVLFVDVNGEITMSEGMEQYFHLY